MLALTLAFAVTLATTAFAAPLDVDNPVQVTFYPCSAKVGAYSCFPERDLEDYSATCFEPTPTADGGHVYDCHGLSFTYRNINNSPTGYLYYTEGKGNIVADCTYGYVEGSQALVCQHHKRF